MKRILAFFLTLVVAVTTLCAADKNEAVKFDEETYDFGTISNKHEPIKYEFTFTNMSDKPVVILSATASCGCTRPKHTHEPVRPGEKGVISVTFEPSGQLGYVKKFVKVKYIVDGKKKNATLKICGSVFRSE